MTKEMSTHDKLLLTAIDLITEKGYNGVTTQEIAAAAGFSEKTLFRHFGRKRNLLETAFDRFNYNEEMIKIFNEKLVWELETDLLLISRKYHEIMNRNRKMIMISIKEEGNLLEFRERLKKHPQQLMEVLIDYFAVMFEKGKLIQTNPELQALSFIVMNYGAFINNLDSENNYSSLSLDEFIVGSVKTFARALTP